MRGIERAEIAAAALGQFGSFFFLTTLVFRPEVLTPFQSGDSLVLEPLPLTLLTVTVMVVAGAMCIAAALSRSLVPRRAIACVGVTFPLLALLLLTVRHPLVPVIVALLCAAACLAQVFTFARRNMLGFSETVLSAGICLAAAGLASEAAYGGLPLHVHGSMALTAAMLVSGAVLVGKRRRISKVHAVREAVPEQALQRGDGVSDSVAPEADGGLRHQVALGLAQAAVPALWEGAFCAASLGMTWHVEGFPFKGGDGAFFTAGVLVAFFLWAALWLVERRYRRADVVVYAAALPAFASLVLFIWNDAAFVPGYYICAVACEFFLLSLLWSSALAMDRSLRHPGLVACGYLIVFVGLFGFFMVPRVFVPTVVLQKVMPMLALAFLAFLLGYAIRAQKSAVGLDENDAAAESFNDVLDSRCAAIADECGLSPRERELLPFVALGMSSTEIGARFFISPQTVKTHRYRMYRKIGISSHGELVEIVSPESCSTCEQLR